MSSTKKRAAPKPPQNESLQTNESQGNDRSSKPAAKKDIALKIILPNLSTDEIIIPYNTPLMDLRMQLCAKYKLSPSSHIIEPVNEKDGRSIPHQSSSQIGLLSVSAVAIKSKTKEPVKVTSPKKVEQTVRLTIKMSRSNHQVLRISPNLPLAQLIPQILEKSGIQDENHPFLELRHPDQKTMALDISRSLNDYKIKEVYLADKRVHVDDIREVHDIREDSFQTPEKQPAPKGGKTGSEKKSKKLKSFFRLSKKYKNPPLPADTNGSPIQPSSSSSPPEEPKALSDEAKQSKTGNINENNSKNEQPVKKKHAAPIKPANDEGEPINTKSAEATNGHVQEVQQEKAIPKIDNEDIENSDGEIRQNSQPISPPPRAPPRCKPRPPVPTTRPHTTGKKKAPPPPTRKVSEEDPPSPKPRPSKPPRKQSVKESKDENVVVLDEQPDSEPEKAPESDVVVDKPEEVFVVEVEKQPDVKPEPDDEVKSKNLDEISPPLYEEKEVSREVEIADSIAMAAVEAIEEADLESLESDGSAKVEEVVDVPDSHLEVEQEVSDNIQDNGPREVIVVLGQKTEETEMPDVQFQVHATGVSDVHDDNEGQIHASDDEDNSPSPNHQAEQTPEEKLPAPQFVDEEEEEVEYEPGKIPVGVEEHISFVVEDTVEDAILEKVTIPADTPENTPESSENGNAEIENTAAFATEDAFDDLKLAGAFVDEREEFAIPRVEFSMDDEQSSAAEIKDQDKSPEVKSSTLEVEQTESPHEEEIPEEKVDNGNDCAVDDDDETVQEIEKIKKQILKMRNKKAEKEAAKNKPFTIIEGKRTVETGSVPKTGMKSFTFVPNQNNKAVYEDYDVAPVASISLSHSGEIRRGNIPDDEEGDKKVPSPVDFKKVIESKQDVPVLKEVSVAPPLAAINSKTTENHSVKSDESQLSEVESMAPEVIVIEKVDTIILSLDKEEKPQVLQTDMKEKHHTRGGYVSSAALRQNSDGSSKAVSPQQSFSAFSKNTGSEDSSTRKSALPNYYKRFFGMRAMQSTAEDSKIVKARKAEISIDTVATRPKEEATIIRGKNGAEINDTVPPPAEKEVITIEPVNQLPQCTAESTAEKPRKVEEEPESFPPPPAEFLTPNALPIVEKTDHQLVLEENAAPPPVAAKPSKLWIPPVSSPDSNGNSTRVVSPVSLNLMAAKPFGISKGGGRPKFRPMSASFKDDVNLLQPDYFYYAKQATEPNNNRSDLES